MLPSSSSVNFLMIGICNAFSKITHGLDENGLLLIKKVHWKGLFISLSERGLSFDILRSEVIAVKTITVTSWNQTVIPHVRNKGREGLLDLLDTRVKTTPPPPPPPPPSMTAFLGGKVRLGRGVFMQGIQKLTDTHLPPPPPPPPPPSFCIGKNLFHKGGEGVHNSRGLIESLTYMTYIHLKHPS